ncbi:glutathione reductase (NADPH) [Pustulibacterium marinum]|uniref:Glutathione reductase (NADPH) n=1 Tax=Pustulibacterium marinum TaxID=1224947 RepID=A0A1I7I7B5_9FLAO|nr:NAD(P)/FAD-dependent oxidoreductase [Pustulibacterium marinum]SFU68666.1 glutathione reductase (NADPH) [Pustulibacterium marinum]
MSTTTFDVFVIGTGTAGRSVALACAKAGKKVGIADNREFGGTCSNRGCDPKKVLVGLTEILHRSENMLGSGITKLPEVSWSDVQEFKKKFTEGMPEATEKDLQEEGITMYHQSPKFTGEHELLVEGKKVIAEKIVIATGRVPMPLRISGGEHALTSDDFLELKELPESMVFIGAGYIGMEFAHIAARMGVKVTVIDVSGRPLSNFEEDMVSYITKASEELGIQFYFNTEVTNIKKLIKNYKVIGESDGKKVTVKTEMIFNTAGRIPAVAELNLEEGNVSYSDKGIKVTKKLKNTSNRDVYACGDVADSSGLPLTPLSSKEAEVVISQLLEEEKEKMAEYAPQPSVVFTIPQMASVGLTEEEAKASGEPYQIEQKYVPSWFNSKRIHEKYYAYKTIVNTETGQIMGAHIVAPEAGEMINLFSMAMYSRMTKKDFMKMILAYPTWGYDIRGMI